MVVFSISTYIIWFHESDSPVLLFPVMLKAVVSTVEFSTYPKKNSVIFNQNTPYMPIWNSQDAPAGDDDDDLDLFGDETEEEKKAAEEREAAKKTSSKKKESKLYLLSCMIYMKCFSKIDDK